MPTDDKPVTPPGTIVPVVVPVEVKPGKSETVTKSTSYVGANDGLKDERFWLAVLATLVYAALAVIFTPEGMSEFLYLLVGAYGFYFGRIKK